MASDETMMSSTIDSSFQDEEEEFEDDNIGDHHHHTNPHNLSRLSVCTTSSTMCGVEDDVDNLASMCMSHLSIESFEGGDNGGGGGGVEADGEFSDGKEEDNINYLLQTGGLSSDENYDELSGSCYSLPARKKNETQTLPSIGMKEYASENEAKKETKSKRRRRRRDTWVGEKENIWGVNSNEDKKKESGGCGSNGTTAAGLMVITRPKGGNRSLCMDLEEVKACRDLGFELEHERMLEIINPPTPPNPSSSSSRLSFSNSTSSGGNSPIANWRISAPGDDPRDVKARLKMWAQAVALASASSKYSS